MMKVTEGNTSRHAGWELRHAINTDSSLNLHPSGSHSLGKMSIIFAEKKGLVWQERGKLNKCTIIFIGRPRAILIKNHNDP